MCETGGNLRYLKKLGIFEEPYSRNNIKFYYTAKFD